MYSWKKIFSSYIELAKNQKRIGRFSWSQKPFNKKLYFELCFQLLKKLNRDKSKKPTKSIMAKKEKGYQQYGILFFSESWKPWTRSSIGTLFWPRLNHGAGTCKLSCCVWHSNIQEEKSVCHNQEIECERATLHSDSTLHFLISIYLQLSLFWNICY